jgi:hypothetical protein
VAGSYLARVALVGRRRELDQVRLELSAVRHSRGGVVLVQGFSGGGVTRFLDEAAIEAQLRGATVVRTSATADSGDFQVVRSLARSLMERLPDVRQAPSARNPSLTTLLPELDPAAAKPAAENAAAQTPPPRAGSGIPEASDAHALQRALHLFLTEAGRARSLCFVINDLQ